MGLSCGDVSRSALFVSHYHGDHIGMVGEVVDGLPVYVGKTALEVFRCVERRLSYVSDTVEAERYRRLVERSASFLTFEALQSIRVGDMVVTLKGAGRCFVCDDKHNSSFYDMDFDSVDAHAGRIIVFKRWGREALSFGGRLKPYLERHGFCLLIRVTDAFESLLDEYAASFGFACYYSQWARRCEHLAGGD